MIYIWGGRGGIVPYMLILKNPLQTIIKIQGECTLHSNSESRVFTTY